MDSAATIASAYPAEAFERVGRPGSSRGAWPETWSRLLTEWSIVIDGAGHPQPDASTDVVQAWLMSMINDSTVSLPRLSGALEALRYVSATSTGSGRFDAVAIGTTIDRCEEQWPVPTVRAIQDVIAALEEAINGGERPALRCLARSRGLDPERAGRQIAELTGLTFCAWRGLYCVRKALRGLIDAQDRPSVTAYSIGFKCPSQLARCFRAHTGMNATQYRRRWWDYERRRSEHRRRTRALVSLITDECASSRRGWR